MARATRLHEYKGYSIAPCEYGGRDRKSAYGAHYAAWIIIPPARNGLVPADELCPHARTIAAAHALINYWNAEIIASERAS